MYAWLILAHIAGLGYWLGSELVINSTYRYVCFADQMPSKERLRLMDHVMKVDQHVRYALVLQATTGAMLVLWLLPGGSSRVMVVGVLGGLWLLYVEVVHRLSGTTSGRRLATVDRWSRVVLMVLCAALALGLLGLENELPVWLRVKLALFAGVIASGIGIRLVLLKQIPMWRALGEGGGNQDLQSGLGRTYWQATSVLILLWCFIAAIVAVSVLKPS